MNRYELTYSAVLALAGLILVAVCLLAACFAVGFEYGASRGFIAGACVCLIGAAICFVAAVRNSK